MPLPLKDFPRSVEDVAQRQKGDKVSPKVTERAPPLPCGELPPQRLRGLQIGEARKSATATTAASGGYREELLGQRPAGCECRPRHEADAGGRNPSDPARRNRCDLAALNTRHLLRKPVCGLKAPLGLSCPAGTAVLSGSLLCVKREQTPPRCKRVEIAAPLPSGASLTERHSSSALRIASFTTAYANPRRCSAATTRSRRPAASLFL